MEGLHPGRRDVAPVLSGGGINGVLLELTDAALAATDPSLDRLLSW